MVARGAPVTGLGAWGPFNAQQTIPSATGSFGGIAVGPGPNGGKVIVTYQNPTGGQGPSTIYANVDADGLGAGGFGSRSPFRRPMWAASILSRRRADARSTLRPG